MPSRLVVLMSLALAPSAFAHEGTPSDFNYRDDVRPIFVKHCASCHQPGGVGPMSLLSYSDAVPWANAVKIQILEAQMPPWLPADGIGAFEHTRSLSAEEIDIIIDWVIGQTPEGPPMTAEEIAADAPPLGTWAMGTPDLVLTPEAEVVIGEDDYELTECVVLPTGTTEEHVVTAFELRPGTPTLVRRATVYLGDTCDVVEPIVTWIPGQGAATWPDGHGRQVPAGASLAVEILYVKGWEDEGKRITDRSELGVQFSSNAAAVETVHVAKPSHTFDRAVEIVAVYPDSREKAEAPVRVDAVAPDGTRTELLVIEAFRPEWREKYILSSPIGLPAGTTLEISQTTAWVDFTPAGE